MVDTAFLEGLQSSGQETYKGQAIVPIFELRGYSDACEFCRGKMYDEYHGTLYGPTGTYAELEENNMVPLFHENCRCWLAVIGYCLEPIT